MIPFMLLALAAIASAIGYPGRPEVTNVRGQQRTDGSELVDVFYDLADSDSASLTVGLQVSADEGSTWTVPVATVSQAVGTGVTPGKDKHILWSAGADWNNQYSNKVRFAVYASDTPPITGEFALIPAGWFEMGDQSNPLVGSSNELPVHSVYVSTFYMGRYEVTKELWDEVRAWGMNNGYTDLPAGNGSYPSKGANHPVHSITWYAMVKWCNARSEMEGLTPCYAVSGAIYQTGDNAAVVCNWSANGYRLPTETEWEKAARGGVAEKNFPWGTDTISQSQANYCVYSSNGTTNYFSYDVTPRPPATGTSFYHPSYNAGGHPYSSPVGSFAPNGYGLYDMAGNMWEWCWDRIGSYAAGSQTDPRGPASGSNPVMRGGGWNYYGANSCRVAYRSNYYPVSSNSHLGFRMARSSVP